MLCGGLLIPRPVQSRLVRITGHIPGYYPISARYRVSSRSIWNWVTEGELRKAVRLVLSYHVDAYCCWALCHHAKLFQGFMILRDSPDSLSNSVTSDRERRTAQRYAFVATTEMTGSGSAGTLSGRVTEISREGCYVDILNALPAGTLLNVRIICDKGTFVTKGRSSTSMSGLAWVLHFLIR